MSQSVYQKCEAAVIVFNVTDYATLKAAKQCLTKLKRKVGDYPTKFILVGNQVLTSVTVVLEVGILLGL